MYEPGQHNELPLSALSAGELMNRPHSEVKAWTPPDAPPPAAQSAPPELAERDQTATTKAQGTFTSYPE